MQYNRRNRDRRGGHKASMIIYNGIGGNTPIQKRLLKKRQRKYNRQQNKMFIKIGMEHYDIDLELKIEDDFDYQYFGGLYLTPEQIRNELDSMFGDHPPLDDSECEVEHYFLYEAEEWYPYDDPYGLMYDPWY